jgi:hypothetical protein
MSGADAGVDPVTVPRQSRMTPLEVSVTVWACLLGRGPLPVGRMLRATLVTLLSGPLAGYGQAEAEALAMWAEGFAGRPVPRPVAYDAHPDPTTFSY